MICYYCQLGKHRHCMNTDGKVCVLCTCGCRYSMFYFNDLLHMHLVGGGCAEAAD